MNVCKKILKEIEKKKALSAILLMLFVMLFFDTRFYTTYNLLDMFNSAAILEIMAFGVTLVIICGGCDFSIGATMSLAGIITIKLMDFMPIWCAIIVAILCGAAVGVVNGFLVVQQKTEPFIITLGMGMLLKGVAQQITDAHPVPAKNLSFMKIANSKVFGIPSLILIMLAMLLIFYGILRFTQFGRNCYAIGGDYTCGRAVWHQGPQYQMGNFCDLRCDGGILRRAAFFQAEYGFLHLWRQHGAVCQLRLRGGRHFFRRRHRWYLAVIYRTADDPAFGELHEYAWYQCLCAAGKRRDYHPADPLV